MRATAAAGGGFSPVEKSKARTTVKKLVAKEKLGGVFEDVPDQVLQADDVDFAVWAVLATDDTLRRVVELHKERVVKRKRGLRANRADKISDVGLKVLGEGWGPLMLHAEIGQCTRVTDAGLRALTMNSPFLQTLVLDGLTKLQGAGLATVAASCPGLVTLSLNGCGQFDDWTYQAVSRGCRELRHLNLDNCPKISDDAVKSFAKQCPRLRSMHLSGCKQVSDVAILQLSNSCTSLEVLDLSRSELAFKVTDVSMLALGERCHALTDVNVSGCQFLTDAGVEWLVGGCTALTSLNLSGLFKVTDTGMLSVSERCAGLTNLNISGVKKVSDVGLRYLSQGCPRLQILDATGVFLITDGKTRDFGLEGLQALCKVVSNLKTLKLPGCYNVGAIALGAIGSGCKQLEHLNLANCPKLNAAGLGAVTAGCKALTYLCLRGCDHLHDDSLRAIARNAPQLMDINLSDVEGITDSGVAALVRGCKALQHITLKHCKGVSDLSLLAMAEAKMSPGVKELNLLGCYDVTDTGVSWLAERMPTLTKLNVLGCAVSRPGLRAMLHSWKYVAIRDDDTWLGLWPAERAGELKFIEDFGDQWKAAQKLQALVRGRRARRLAAAMREANLKQWVAKRLQSRFRARKCRRAYIIRLMKRRTEHEVATKLQTRFRMRIARREAARKRQERYIRRCNEAATMMQKIFRGKRARDLMRLAREARLRYYQRCMDAASDVQRIWRGRKGRRTFEMAQVAKEAQEKAKAAAVLNINRLLRGKLGRLEARKRRQWWNNRREREEWAATYVQRQVRSLIARRVLQRLRNDEALRNKAATWIQSRWRAHRGRLSAHVLVAARRMRREYDAAALVQALWRGKKGRTILKGMKAEMAAMMAAQESSATRMQSIFRGFKDRKATYGLRKRMMMERLKTQDMFAWGAINIQRVFRGYLGRKRVRVLRLQRDRRWKEMWDDASGRAFFYDKNTGEIRWRRPQQLLNLLPRPLCNNCDVTPADFECKDCCEFYCTTCFPQIHYGGKRKAHRFRPLYDAYGARVDYGEGEWPSVWPSEIQQDEFHGWALLHTGAHDTSGGGGGAGAVDGYPYTSPEHQYAYHSPAQASPDPNSLVLHDGGSVWSQGGGTTTSAAYLPNYSMLSSDAESSVVTGPTYDGQPPLDSGEAGWTKHWDDTHGREFYYHTVTGASSWERPLEYSSPRYDGQPVTETGNNGWTKHYDAMYFADFYYNEFTGETTWERPVEYTTPRPLDASTGSSGWSKFWDEVNRRDYYFNASTGESTFDVPAGFV